MITEFFRNIKKRLKSRSHKLDPDEIFLDSGNLPDYDRDQFEGRIEKPIKKRNLYVVAFAFLVILLLFVSKVSALQIVDGKTYADKAANNQLRKDLVFADRGMITDRNGKPLAWNEVGSTTPFASRKYIDETGFSNILGYVKYPQKDSSGNFYTTALSGQAGAEKYFDSTLAGHNGSKLTEVDVKGNVLSESTIDRPENGNSLALSIDAGLQHEMYDRVANAVESSHYAGGAGVFMDAKTGEVLAAVTYPEYDSQTMTDGKDTAAIKNFLQSSRKPFLDRYSDGLYAPGSTIKPFIAVGVLNEGLIDPMKTILSTGSISLPNPYDPAHPSIFKDWRPQGYVDMRHAIAVSSDVYFYEVGGGFQGQKGLGISKIDEYLKKFLFSTSTDGFFSGPAGTIPTPEWKKENFADGEWRVGDTYHTTIGQYGFQATPLQLARAVTGIANEGTVVSPTAVKGEQGETSSLGVNSTDYTPVKEGMRLAVTGATAIALNVPGLEAAAKTGTAQLGVNNEYVNSWVEGFIPYQNPKYVFVIVLEKGPPHYTVSAMQTMGQVLTWARDNEPEYVK